MTWLTEWMLLLSLGREVKDAVHGLCCCHHKGQTQLGVLRSRTFLSANMQGFWPRGALSECWCQTSNPDTECHWWTRLRVAPYASDLDLDLEGDDRQTGTYFFHIFTSLENQETGVFCREGGCGSCLLRQWRRDGSKIMTCLTIYVRTYVRWCGGKEGWAERVWSRH